jgi:hypothetical protein
MGPEWIAPTIAGIIALATALTAGLISIRNTRTGAVENRAPSANQAWNETDRARARMHAFEDRFWTVLAALKHLVRSLKQEHPNFVLTEDVVKALEIEPPEDEPDK